MSTPAILTASASNCLIDGKQVPGIQSIQFGFTRTQQNINSVSSDERIGVHYGPVVVRGSIQVRSFFEPLDKKMYETIPQLTHFQIVFECGVQGSDKPAKKHTFDESYLESKSLAMDATGVAITTYNFTSTRVREG